MSTCSAERTYRSQYVPRGVEADEVEDLARRNLLPVVQFKAADGDAAAKTANRVTGRPIFATARIEAHQGVAA